MFPEDATVVIPTRNRPDYLLRAIASVAEHFDQIIVIDDCSTVPVEGHIQGLGGSGLRCLRNEVQLGAASARNIACGYVNTEWILFLDDDDVITKGAVEQYIEVTTQAPGFDAWFWEAPSSKLAEGFTTVQRADLGCRNLLGGCSGVLIRRTAFKAVGGFDGEMVSMQDWDLWIRLLDCANLGFSRSRVVDYEHESPQKITHNLKSKYYGLRRLLSKHRNFFTSKERNFHIKRLKVLRLLLGGERSLLGNWRRLGGWPFAIYYTYRWRGYVSSPSK